MPTTILSDQEYVDLLTQDMKLQSISDSLRLDVLSPTISDTDEKIVENVKKWREIHEQHTQVLCDLFVETERRRNLPITFPR